MSATTIDQSNIDRMSDKDKAELRQFISNEQQRGIVQSQTHTMTQMCWKKCVGGPVNSNALDKTEDACLANCVDRFLDVNAAIVKHLQTMRRS